MCVPPKVSYLKTYHVYVPPHTGLTDLITQSRFSPASPMYIYMQYMLHIFSLVTDKQSVGRQWGYENTPFFIKIPTLFLSFSVHWWFLSEPACTTTAAKLPFPTLVTKPALVIDKGNIFNASSIRQSNVLLSCLETQPNNILKITLYDFCLRTFGMIFGQKY